MSMSDPFLPTPPPSEHDAAEPEVDDLDRDEQPDVLPGPGDDELGESRRDAGAFQRPEAGERLTAEELQRDLE